MCDTFFQLGNNNPNVIVSNKTVLANFKDYVQHVVNTAIVTGERKDHKTVLSDRMHIWSFLDFSHNRQ